MGEATSDDDQQDNVAESADSATQQDDELEPIVIDYQLRMRDPDLATKQLADDDAD